jgi:polyisoprenoid-binding protein YceI
MNYDFLVTYLLHPGTAIYVGYNTNLENVSPDLCVRLAGTTQCDPNGPACYAPRTASSTTAGSSSSNSITSGDRSRLGDGSACASCRFAVAEGSIYDLVVAEGRSLLMFSRLTTGLLVSLLATASFAVEKFAVDSGHSKIGFTVTLAGVTDVDGRFNDFDGTISYDGADLTNSSVTAIIKTASIDTGNSDRDNDLRGTNFFDANKYPTIRFQSKSIEKHGNDYVMTGTLTIRDVTRDVVIPVLWRQREAPDPWQNTRIGFEGRLTLQRKDYGVIGPAFWNNAISDAVEIELRITAQIPNYDRWNFQAPQGKKPIGAVVYDSIQRDGLEVALRQYKELKQQPAIYAFGPGQLNLVGKKLLQHGKNKEALEILKMKRSSTVWETHI